MAGKTLLTVDASAPAPEAALEVIPEGWDLTVAITLDRWTMFRVSGWTEQILELAKAILAAESKWMPGELLEFARNVLALRSAKMLPLGTDPSSLEHDAANDEEREQLLRTRDALIQLRTLVREIFHEASKRLEREFDRWDVGKGHQAIQ